MLTMKNYNFKGCLKFLEKPWFENPLRIREKKKLKKKIEKIKEKQINLPDFGNDRNKYISIAKK